MNELPEAPNNVGQEHRSRHLYGGPLRRRLRIPAPSRKRGGLLEYWRILRRRKGTLILMSPASEPSSVSWSLFRRPPSTRPAPLSKLSGLNQNFLNMKESNPLDRTAEPRRTPSDIQTQIKILQSDSLLDRVVAKLESTRDAQRRYAGRIAAWRKILNLPDPEPQSTPGSRPSPTPRKISKCAPPVKPASSRSPSTRTSPRPPPTSPIPSPVNSSIRTSNPAGKPPSTPANCSPARLDDMRIRLEKSEDRLQQYANQAGLLFTDDDKRQRLRSEAPAGSAGPLRGSNRPHLQAVPLGNGHLQPRQKRCPIF